MKFVDQPAPPQRAPPEAALIADQTSSAIGVAIFDLLQRQGECQGGLREEDGGSVDPELTFCT